MGGGDKPGWCSSSLMLVSFIDKRGSGALHFWAFTGVGRLSAIGSVESRLCRSVSFIYQRHLVNCCSEMAVRLIAGGTGEGNRLG
jgi:hypothetical protein